MIRKMYLVKYLTRNLKSTFLKRDNICFCRFYNVLTDEIPDISITGIKKLLKNNNLQYEDGHTCIITNCPICNNKKNDLSATSSASVSSAKIYINKMTGRLF